ncbi:MAG: iron-containing alcohol dehydrogenase [Synergistaceae bacterium]|nr:iron-containing alcohol dehydrogenase [Synergistaceae bacterium]
MPANVKASTGYSIKIRKGLVARLGLEILRLSEEEYHEIALITDEKVSGLYLQQVIMNVKECPKPEGTKLRICELLIKSHEDSKNFGTIAKLLEDMASLGLSKNCVVVALGGGVVCDAAGFAAAVYMGGVRLVLVPTTLAAMVKASAGNLARVNLSAGENLAGMPYAPSLVLCDTECLRTLPDDEYRSGLAEALKTAVVSGEEMFRIFERGTASENIERVIEECIKFRAEIADNEARMKGLKLGCVVGSAIGALSGYGIQHGLATAQGIGITARASAKMKWCSEETSQRIINTLERNNLPCVCTEFKASEIAKTAVKSGGRIIDMIVPCEIGRCEVKHVKAEELESIISLGMSR